MAVVDDPDVEVGLGRQAGDGLPDVPCPDHDQTDTRPVRQERETAVNRRLGPFGRAERSCPASPSGIGYVRPARPRPAIAVEQESRALCAAPPACLASTTIASVNPRLPRSPGRASGNSPSGPVPRSGCVRITILPPQIRPSAQA